VKGKRQNSSLMRIKRSDIFGIGGKGITKSQPNQMYPLFYHSPFSTILFDDTRNSVEYANLYVQHRLWTSL